MAYPNINAQHSRIRFRHDNGKRMCGNCLLRLCATTKTVRLRISPKRVLIGFGDAIRALSSLYAF